MRLGSFPCVAILVFVAISSGLPSGTASTASSETGPNVTIQLFQSLSYSNITRMATQVRMQEKTLKVTVNYDTKDEKWAGHVLDLVARSLQRIEELGGFPYPFSSDITIFVQQGDNNYILYEKGSIYLIPGTWDFAILHELAHYWTTIYGRGGGPGKRWLQEAYATIIPLVIFEERGEVEKVQEVKDAHLWWFQHFFSQYEQPLDVWKGEDTKNIHDFLYGKAYCFIYILYKAFGIKTLSEVSHRIHDKHMVADSIAFKTALETATGKDLGDLFSGWVFGKSYKEFRPEDFTDQDGDGLLAIDERFLGTDPLKADTDGDGVWDGLDPHPLDPLPENAPKLIARAEQALRKAEQEGRTQGLDIAREKLVEARSALDSGRYDDAVLGAREALELAEKAVAVTTTATTTAATETDWFKANWLYLPALATVAVIALFLFARKLQHPS